MVLLTIRTSKKTVAFSGPFVLGGWDEMLPAAPLAWRWMKCFRAPFGLAPSGGSPLGATGGRSGNSPPPNASQIPEPPLNRGTGKHEYIRPWVEARLPGVCDQVLRPEKGGRRLSEMWRQAAATESAEGGATGMTRLCVVVAAGVSPGRRGLELTIQVPRTPLTGIARIPCGRFFWPVD